MPPRHHRSIRLGALLACLPLACAQPVVSPGSSDGTGDWDGSTSDGSGRGVGDGVICDEMAIRVDQVIPDVLVVLDRSASMSLGGHWDPVRQALYDITAETGDAIRFGLMVFPSSEEPEACVGLSMTHRCAPPQEPLLPCALGNGPAIQSALEGLDTCGATPAAQTLEAARAFLERPDRRDPAAVLLATDGGPTCNDGLDGSSCHCVSPMGGCSLDPSSCLDAERSYETIDALRSVGIDVHVVGVSAGDYGDVLDEMAARGGTGAALMADDPAGVRSAFEAVAGAVASCEVELQAPDASADPDQVNLYLDGDPVPFDTDGACEQGWQWADGETRRVRFCGESCDHLRQSGGGLVTATFGCPTLI